MSGSQVRKSYTASPRANLGPIEGLIGNHNTPTLYLEIIRKVASPFRVDGYLGLLPIAIAFPDSHDAPETSIDSDPFVLWYNIAS